MKNIPNNKNGFTLIELLVVISIISLLTSIVLTSLADAKAKGRDASRIRAMIETRSALQLFFSDKGYYPNETEFGYIKSGTAGYNNYIKSIHPEIIYKPTINSGIASCTISGTCTGYHMGIKLEKKNSVLSSDADQNNAHTFYGLSIANECLTRGATPVTDLCYDIVVK